ncbi:MAG: glycosyltransferase, partial [Gammaproteobacteria bacterium]
HEDLDGSLVSWGIDTRMLPVFREWVRPGSVTLETGAGISTILFLLLGAIHRSITPIEGEVEKIIQYCAQHGISTANYHPIVGTSERVLPGLPAELELNFALIDGNHAFPAPLIDWYYLTDHLPTYGVIAIDDVSLWPCRLLVDFLDEEEVWQRLTRNDRFAVYYTTAPGNEVVQRWWRQQPYVVRRTPGATLVGEPEARPEPVSADKTEEVPRPTRISTAGRSRPKVTVAVPFGVYPAVGGGQQRVFSLYRHVARDFDVELVTLVESDSDLSEREIAPGLKEIRVPKSKRHQKEEARLMQEVGGVPIGDIGIPLFIQHTPDYGRQLARSAETAALLVASHPYGLAAMREVLGDKPLVYEAQDVEYLLKKAVLGSLGEVGEGLAEAVRGLEAEACQASRLVLCCSTHDRDELRRLYGVEPDRVVIVPNGVDTEAVRFTPADARERLKADLGLDGQRIALFVGSWHPPNLEAAEAVFEIARAMPDVKFLLAGSQCLPLADRLLPANVGLMGVVDDETLALLLAVADVALNPMLGGSGTNLKLAMYLAAGVPVVTTPVGARGYELAEGRDALIRPAVDFPVAITALLSDRELAEGLARRGRRLVEERYDWKTIASDALAAFRAVLHVPSGGVDPLDELIERVSVSMAELRLADNPSLANTVASAIAEVGGLGRRNAPAQD